MNGTQNRRNLNTEKPVPGCLGRVVNIFDLSTRVGKNSLLTDKPHIDGIGHSRRQSDAMRISSIGDALDDEMGAQPQVASELGKSSSRYLNGTSVKMLMAEEMSKEMELKHNSPNLVAKLMGLDDIPRKQPDIVVKRCHSRSYSGSNLGIELDSGQQEYRSKEQKTCKEFPDMTWRSRKGRHMREKTPEKGRHVEASNEKKMDFVRQKFAEAKSLSANEKHRQSKRFQDALEILSSNRGLFLKLLQEQNTFSCTSPPTETKRITLLKPSKILDDHQIPRSARNFKTTSKTLEVGQVTKVEKRNIAFSPTNSRLSETPIQPTRIVVLKPSGKPHNKKDGVSLSPSFPRLSEEIHVEPLDDDILDSREIAKGIRHQESETLSEHFREETIDSSIFSNGYNGDESSFHKSENEYNLENLSDSEVVTPISTHSWEYIHKFERPYSSSSFSHASCSAESSVCKEAKKRLSERWVLMASNGNCQEQRHVQRSSSTLGEMLALSDAKKLVKSEEEDIIGEEEIRLSPLCSTSNLNIDQFVSDSPKNLLRSKSVPASSTVFSPNRVVDPRFGKEKTTTPKSSLKEKFSGLFFSRNKRHGKDKSSSSQYKNETEKSPNKILQARDEVCEVSSAMEEDSLGTLQGLPDNSSSQNSIDMERKPGTVSLEAKLCLAKPLDPQNKSENQDQPSPVSVLEPPFEEDESNTTDSSNAESDKYGNAIKSSLIGKSPYIESIARTLSWDDPCVDTATSFTFKTKRVSQIPEEEDEQFLFLVKSLLSAAGYGGEVTTNSLFLKWHSPESPLDPSLRDNYINGNVKNMMHEAKQRQRIATYKLVFDAINTALEEIVSYHFAKRDIRVHKNLLESSPSFLVNDVWGHVKKWFPCEIPEDLLDDDVDISSLAVEATVRKEMSGNIWNELTRLEIDNLGMEIEKILMEELVQELVIEFSGRIRR